MEEPSLLDQLRVPNCGGAFVSLNLFNFRESMSPAFERGDILFLARGSTPISAGDICVFKLSDREIPIVHRAIRVHREVESRH